MVAYKVILDKKMLRLFTTLCMLGVATLSFSGCANFSPSRLTMKFTAGRYLNPNIYHQAAPVVLVIYQLKSATIFKHANFFSLYNYATATLGHDCLDQQAIEITPRQQLVLHLRLEPQTKFIGILAAFREPYLARWRQIIAIKPIFGTTLAIQVNGRTMTLQSQ